MRYGWASARCGFRTCARGTSGVSTLGASKARCPTDLRPKRARLSRGLSASLPPPMATLHPRGPARFHHLLGIALEWCGLDAGAVQAFQDSIKSAPGHSHTWFRLGETLARRGLWLEASEAFGEAARLEPQSPECQGNLVLALA